MADDQKSNRQLKQWKIFRTARLSKEARALFYISALVNRVALKQAGKAIKPSLF